MEFLLYILKLTVCSGVFFGYYHLFLKNRRHHRFNRWYLLCAAACSMLLPLVSIPFQVTGFAPQSAVVTTLDVVSSSYFEPSLEEPVSSPDSGNTLYISWLLLAYATTALFLLFLVFKSVHYIIRLRRKYGYEIVDGIRLYDTVEPNAPFSFFKNIFWNRSIRLDDQQGKQILRHEFYHVSHRHSADIMFLELACSVFWINPFFRLITNECKAIHEFMADEYALQEEGHTGYAETLVQQALIARKQVLTQPFFNNHLKRRLIMMTTNTGKKSLFSRLMVLPVIFILFACFCLRPETGSGKATSLFESAKAVPLRVVIDAGHGGDDGGANSPDNSVKEKDLTLAIAKKIKMFAQEYNVEVQLTRDADVYPNLKERVLMAENFKADAFVSIHIAAQPLMNADGTPRKTLKSGIDIFVPRNNIKQEEQSRVLGTIVLNQLGSIYNVNEKLLQRSEKGIWVLDQAPCPSIIVECGYISNNADLKFITDDKNQEAIAKKILESLRSYQLNKNLQGSNAGVNSAKASSDSLLRFLESKFIRLLTYPPTAHKAGSEKTTFVTFEVEGNSLKATEFSEISNLTNDAAPRGVTVTAIQSKAEQPENSSESYGAEFVAEIVRASSRITIPEDIAAGAREPFQLRFQFVIEKN